MRFAHVLRAGSAGLSIIVCTTLAHGQPGQSGSAGLAAEIELLKRQLAEQRALLDQMRRQLAEQQRILAGTPATQERLAAQRGTGPAGGAAAAAARMGEPAGTPAGSTDAAQAGAQSGAQAAASAGAGPDAAASVPGLPQPVAQASGQGAGQGQAQGPAGGGAGAGGVPGGNQPAVGQAPQRDGRPPEVAPLFEAPGVLTPKGRYVLEPSYQFGYSSSNRVVLVGYTIIPALLIGLVDVREVKRNTMTAALAGRYGLSRRTELEVRVPYVYRSDSTVSREIFTGSAVENVFSTSGRGVGDVELALRHQLNDGGADKPYYVAGLRVKTRTGRDPFEVVTDCAGRCVGPNATGTGLPLDLPTGSGFYSVQPSVTWLFPSDPAILFGSVSYLRNVKRSNVRRVILNGEFEDLGTLKPGDVFGFNFGMGLALNEKASLSLGYSHDSMGRTKQNGVPVPGSVRTQLGTLLMGFSYRFNEQRSLNVSVGAGLTRDTPDVTLSVRFPMSF
ncbi:acetate kinase [Pseudoduganella sp. LjRoot289]|uniref:acetate kinase n=1 Tax=Pseudoduganella sp. LjRoot289 TaxID=3342314 RepID=UPI003ECF35DE